jgi:hypothetical protein
MPWDGLRMHSQWIGNVCQEPCPVASFRQQQWAEGLASASSSRQAQHCFMTLPDASVTLWSFDAVSIVRAGAAASASVAQCSCTHDGGGGGCPTRGVLREGSCARVGRERTRHSTLELTCATVAFSDHSDTSLSTRIRSLSSLPACACLLPSHHRRHCLLLPAVASLLSAASVRHGVQKECIPQFGIRRREMRTVPVELRGRLPIGR